MNEDNLSEHKGKETSLLVKKIVNFGRLYYKMSIKYVYRKNITIYDTEVIY